MLTAPVDFAKGVAMISTIRLTVSGRNDLQKVDTSANRALVITLPPTTSSRYLTAELLQALLRC